MNHDAIGIQIIPDSFHLDPAGLFYIILCIIFISVNGLPALGRDESPVICKGKFKGHISADSFHFSLIRTLPDGSVLKIVDGPVPGIPYIIWDLVHINVIGQPLVIGIDNGTIACIGNRLAERIDVIRNLLL